MGYNKDMVLKGICLRAINYKEKDKLLTIATFQKGKISVTARGVRSPSAKLKAGCMPLVFGEFSISQGKGFPVLTGIDIQENFYNCWTDSYRNLSALLILEFLEKVTLGEQDISTEIILALKALNEINYGNVYPYALSLWFMLKILGYAGVDYREEELFENAFQIFDAIIDMESHEVETLDILPKNILMAIEYLDLIIKNRLSIKLHIVDQIKALNK